VYGEVENDLVAEVADAPPRQVRFRIRTQQSLSHDEGEEAVGGAGNGAASCAILDDLAGAPTTADASRQDKGHDKGHGSREPPPATIAQVVRKPATMGLDSRRGLRRG